MEKEKELMPDLKPVPDPVYEEEERSGDNDWETEEGVDQEKEEEKEDLEMERERDRLEMEKERQELEKEREAEQEREKMERERELERQREEWERMREEMERRREGNYDEEAGLPYPYPPGYYLLKVRAKESNVNMLHFSWNAQWLFYKLAVYRHDDDNWLSFLCNRDSQVKMENQDKRWQDFECYDKTLLKRLKREKRHQNLQQVARALQEKNSII